MKNLSQTLLKYSNQLILVLVFIIAVGLRWLYLPSGAISFAYDQARDAFLVLQMLSGHLKILGPPVSGVPGLFHGVLYYYVITPSYYFGHGNPIIVAYFLSFISALVILPVYCLSYLLSKSKTASLLSAIIFAFSFEASQYANLMTNASMGVWFVPLIYIGLFLWINKKYKFAPILTGLALGFSIQSEVALLYHLFPLVLWLFIYRTKINKTQVIYFLIALFLAISSMIVSEIKFGFTGAGGLIYLLGSQDKIVQSKQLSDFIVTFLNQSGLTFAYSIFPLNIAFGGLVGFLMVVVALKSNEFWAKFISSYIFAYTPALCFGGSNMKHILVGVAPAVAISAGVFIWKYLFKYKYLFVLTVVLILFSNVLKIVKENKNGQTIFPLQTDLVLSKEIKVIDYTYKSADKNNFSISTLTSPLYVNTLWSYLYNWYGNSKYGYLPSWVGRDQVGQLGNNLKTASSDVSLHFYIIEPTYGIPDLWIKYANGDQDSMSTLKDKKSFGDLVVEERLIKLDVGN